MTLFGDQGKKRYDKILQYVKGRALHLGSEGSSLRNHLTGDVTNLDIAGSPDIKHNLNVFPYPIQDK